MAISVKRVKLWHREVENRPGALAEILEPLAVVGTDLELIMATSVPGGAGFASVGVFPVSGRKAIAAARAAGLTPAPSMSSLLVTGSNKVGLGRTLAKTLAEADVNIGLVVTLVVGKDFSAVFGFETEADARKASLLLTHVGKAKAPAAGKTPAAPRRPVKKQA